MEITFFSLPRLGISSKIQFFENIITIVDENDPALLKVGNQHSVLRNRWEELSGLYITDSKNPLSQEIFNLDQQRDECILSLWLIVEGYSHSPIPEYKLAGQKLLRNLTLYAKSPSAFIRQKYDVETNNITNLVAGWNADTELAEAVNVLNLSQLTDILTQLNAAHNTKFLERNSMYAGETTDTSPQKQAEAATAYYDLCKALNSWAYTKPGPLYEKTIREVNALIEKTDFSLKQKKGHKKEKPTENE